MFGRTALRHGRSMGQRGFESLEGRRVLSGDGLNFGPFLTELTDVHPRVEEIAAAIQSELDGAVELDLQNPGLDADFATPMEVDVFAIQTPALSSQATGNGSLFISSFAYSTGAPTITVVADAEGVALNASLSLFPGLGFTELEVDPESTYYIGVGQVEGVEGFPLGLSDAVGPYQLDVSYFEPLPEPPEPEDAEPDSISDAADIEGGFVSGFLQADNDVDYFRFTASTDGTLRFFLDALPFVATELRIENADGQLIANEVALFAPVEIGLDVFANETYFASLRGDGTSGYYNLFVTEEVFVEFQPPPDRHGNSIEEATDVSELGPFWFESGVINEVDDVDWFRVTNADGQSSLIQFNPNEAVVAELVDESGGILHTFTADVPFVQDLQQSEIYLRVSSVGERNVGYDFLVLQQDHVTGFDPDLGIGLPVEPIEPSVPEPTTSGPSEPTDQPVGPTLEEIAEMLGFSVEEFIGEVPLDGVPELVPPSAVQPEVITQGELADLLGISIDELTNFPVTDPDTSIDLLEPFDVDQAIAGDIDLDGSVGFTDFLIMSEYYGTEDGAEWQHGNFDDDGDVDFKDFLTLSSVYGI